MRAVIQRVSAASLYVADGGKGECKSKESVFSSIRSGILALVAVEQTDKQINADKLLDSIINYRIFADEQDRMNLSLLDTNSDLMLVSQFTLVANTAKGRKPSFSPAASPEEAKVLFDYLLEQAEELQQKHGFGLATGKFGAMMNIGLTNNGPVTFILDR